uniref:Uncharacterized protein n=1 Tax=Arundo donax TaxID=35708 RepID=A0A0A9B9J1_ARUDO
MAAPAPGLSPELQLLVRWSTCTVRSRSPMPAAAAVWGGWEPLRSAWSDGKACSRSPAPLLPPPPPSGYAGTAAAAASAEGCWCSWFIVHWRNMLESSMSIY